MRVQALAAMARSALRSKRNAPTLSHRARILAPRHRTAGPRRATSRPPRPVAMADDVPNMTWTTRSASIASDNGLARRCDELPAGADHSAFGYGVKSGIGRGGKVLRRVVGLPDNTGTVTDQVLALRLAQRRLPAAQIPDLYAARPVAVSGIKNFLN
jgi:lysozyme family protein